MTDPTLIAVVLRFLSLALPSLAGPETAVVRFITDGDSFETEDGRRVRLLSIDAPELYDCGGTEARIALARLLPVGSRIEMRRGARELDDYGRDLAYVFNARGENVNLEMVRRGFARVDVFDGDGGLMEMRLHAASLSARLESCGLFRGGLWQA